MNKAINKTIIIANNNNIINIYKKENNELRLLINEKQSVFTNLDGVTTASILDTRYKVLV